MARFSISFGALAWAAIALAFPTPALPKDNGPQVAACYRKGAVCNDDRQCCSGVCGTRARAGPNVAHICR
jgi:hypothetical protein